MLRFIAYAVPLVILLLALFGFTVELLDAEPKSGSVIRLALFEQPRVPGQLVLGTWLVEASGLIALFLLAQGRFGAWWLDGLVAGWAAWVFRGPLLVITIVVATKQPQDPWWKLAFGWWVLYSICGLSLAILARRSKLESWTSATEGDVDTALPQSTVVSEVEQVPSESQPIEASEEERPLDDSVSRVEVESDENDGANLETEEVDLSVLGAADLEAADSEPADLEPEGIDEAEPSEAEAVNVEQAQEPKEIVTTETEASDESVNKLTGRDAGKE